MADVTNPELKEYLSTLDQSLQDIHEVVDQKVKEAPDTSEEDFQVAADLLEVFWKRTRRREEIKRGL